MNYIEDHTDSTITCQCKMQHASLQVPVNNFFQLFINPFDIVCTSGFVLDFLRTLTAIPILVFCIKNINNMLSITVHARSKE